MHIIHQGSKRLAYASLLAVLISSCASTPFGGLKLHEDHLKERQIQTKKFDSQDETSILSAASAVLQDMGYNLDESETKLGVITASKARDARNAGEIAGKILLAVLTGVAHATDVSQTITVSLVTSKSSKGGYLLRATFQRIVMNSNNQISAAETLLDEELYKGFFDKLSKAVFLEAQEI